MKLIFNNEQELIVDYFSVADGMMIVKSQWSPMEYIKSLFEDSLAMSVVTYEDTSKEIHKYENYTQFEEIKEDKNDVVTVMVSQNGKGTVDRLNTVETDMSDIKKELENISAMNLSSVLNMAKITACSVTDDAQALSIKDLYDEWNGNGIEYKAQAYLNYNEQLYKVIQKHTSQSDWTPDKTPSLYTPVADQSQGTKDKPIVWVSGMESEKDKYYKDEGVLYLGLEDSKIGLHGQPKDLARYFKVVE